MTHKKLVDISSKWLKRHKENSIIPNCTTIASELVTNTASGECPDVIGWCYWASVLIEIKISRSDFLKDQKKNFRIDQSLGMGEFRYYCCPTDLIKTDELPYGWGLLYCNDKNKIEIIHKASRLIADLDCERTVLLSIIRRI